MSWNFSAPFARVSGPAPAGCPAGDFSLPVTPPVWLSVGCDKASPGQSHIRHIESTNTVRPAVIFILSTCLVVHLRLLQQKLHAGKIDSGERLERELPHPTYFGQRRRLGHMDRRRHVDLQDLIDLR